MKNNSLETRDPVTVTLDDDTLNYDDLHFDGLDYAELEAQVSPLARAAHALARLRAAFSAGLDAILLRMVSPAARNGMYEPN